MGDMRDPSPEEGFALPNGEPVPTISTAPAVYIAADRDDEREDEREEDDAGPAPGAYHWRSALNRWLLTLNPGRTQDEYEKAVGYFFETPGVPQDLSDLTYDLLLAYRGALTMRADRRRRSMPRRGRASDGLSARRVDPWTAGALHGAAGSQPQGDSGARVNSASLRAGPLAPATVNIRLTALRQFMLYAIEQGMVGLGAEQVRSALRRLRNERRRPYQILAEDEWEAFLRASLGPAPATDAASEGGFSDAPRPAPEPAPPAGAHSPWGVTRAQRERARQPVASGEADVAATPPEATEASAQVEKGPIRSAARTHDGRTGARTAQRDHALISLALATGLRAIELSLLDVGDLVSERRRGQIEWWLSLPDEKTKGQRGGRALPLAPELIATLLAYIRSTGRAWENPEDRESPLFLALSRGRTPVAESAASRALMLAMGEPERRYRRLRPEQIRGVIHRVEAQWLAERSGASDDPTQTTGDGRHISPHTLRHSAAIALLLGDEASERPPASVEHVRGWLGHFDIRTTQRYLAHLESRDQRRRFAIRPPGRKPPSEAPADALDSISAHDQPARRDDADQSR